MPSERIQRQIDALLDGAEAAVADRDWERVRELARDVLAFAADDADARAFLDAAERRLGSSEDLGRQPSRARRRRSRSQRRGEDSGRGVPRSSLALGFRQLREFLAEERRAGQSRRSSRRARGQRAAAGGRAIAILFTDMRGSTQLTQRLGDEQAHQVVRQHNQSVREALATQRGREIKHTGDGIMASFLSTSSSVECALGIQRRIGGHEGEEQPILQVRIGINAGEAIADDEDLFGTAVIMASRICDRAEPGQVLVSNVVRELCAGKTFEFTSVGDATLKGFDDPVTLYEVRPG